MKHVFLNTNSSLDYFMKSYVFNVTKMKLFLTNALVNSKSTFYLHVLTKNMCHFHVDVHMKFLHHFLPGKRNSL